MSDESGSEQQPHGPFIAIPMAQWAQMRAGDEALRAAMRRYMTEVAKATLKITEGLASEPPEKRPEGLVSAVTSATVHIAQATAQMAEQLKKHEPGHQ